MGQKLCCFRPPTNPNPKQTSSLSDDSRFLGVESTIMTLEDYLILSPALNGEVSVPLKQPNKRVYPSSPEFDNSRFYTPTVSISSLGKLEKIDEGGGEDGSRKSIMSSSRRPSLKKKKVSFKLPEEAVIIFYSPEQAFDPTSDTSSL